MPCLYFTLVERKKKDVDMLKENDDNLNKLCNRWLVNGILMDAGDMKNSLK